MKGSFDVGLQHHVVAGTSGVRASLPSQTACVERHNVG